MLSIMKPKPEKSKSKSRRTRWWNLWQVLVPPERLKVHTTLNEDVLFMLYGVFFVVLLVLWLLGVISILAVLTAAGLMVTHHMQMKIQTPTVVRHVMFSGDLPWVELKGKSLQEALPQARRFLEKTGVQDPEHWEIGVVVNEKLLQTAPLDWEDSEILEMMRGTRKKLRA